MRLNEIDLLKGNCNGTWEINRNQNAKVKRDVGEIILSYILLLSETRQSIGRKLCCSFAGSAANGQMTNAMYIIVVSWTLGTTLT